MTSTGQAPIYGLFDGTNKPTITVTPPGGSPTSLKIKAVKATVTMGSKIDRQTDANGEVTGYVRRQPIRAVSLEAVVQADTKANAVTALAPWVDLSLVVLANFVTNTETAVLNGSYVYETGMKIELGEQDEGKLTAEIYQFATSAATLLTAVT